MIRLNLTVALSGALVGAFSALSLTSCREAAAAVVPKKVEIDGYTIETNEVTAQPAISVRKTVKTADLTAEFGKHLPATFGYAGEKGGEIAGMPFAIFHRKGADEADIEFGCPLKKAIAGDATFKSVSLPAGRVAVTTHLGSYHELSKAHAVMDKWFKVHGAVRNGPAWEVYADDPTKVEPAKVRTIIYYPIK